MSEVGGWGYEGRCWWGHSILAEVIHPLCWTSSSVSIHWKHSGPVEWNWARLVLSWQGNGSESAPLRGAISGGMGGGPWGRLCRGGRKGVADHGKNTIPGPSIALVPPHFTRTPTPMCATCHWPLQPPSHSPRTFEPVSLRGLQMCVSLHPPKPTTSSSSWDLQTSTL